MTFSLCSYAMMARQKEHCLSSHLKVPNTWWVRDLTLFEVLAGGAFDHLNCQHTEAFDRNFSKKSNAQEFTQLGGGGGGEAWAVLELTGTLKKKNLY